MDLEALRAKLSETSALRPVGRVVGVTGLLLKVLLPGARISDVLLIRRRGEPLLAEVVGFQQGEALAVPLGEPIGVGPDDVVEATGEGLQVSAGAGLLGRVLDGLGRPIDGRPAPTGSPIHGTPTRTASTTASKGLSGGRSIWATASPAASLRRAT